MRLGALRCVAWLAGLLWIVTRVTAGQFASPEEAIARAHLLAEDGGLIDSLILLQRAVVDFPEHAETRHELGLAFHALNRFAAALSAYEQALALAPENGMYRLAYGNAVHQSGRFDEGFEHLRQASRSEGVPAEAWIVLAAAYERRGKPDKAFESLSHYLELAPDDVQTRFVYAEQLVAAKQTDRAVELLRQGLREESDEPSVELLYRIAEAASRGPDTNQDVSRYATRAIELDPTHLPSRLLLARRLGSGAIDEAIALLEPALAIHDDVPELYYALSGWYRRAERLDDAKRAAETFQSLSQSQKERENTVSRVAATYKKAAELLQNGNMLEAEKVFLQVLDIDAEHAQSRAMLAKIAYSKGQQDVAREWIDEALSRDDAIGEYYYLSALFFHKASETPKALEPARRAVSLDPGFPDAWSLLATIRLALGRPEQAIDCLETVSALEPTNPVVFLSLAEVYEQLGDAAASQRAIERYEELMR